MQPGTRSFGRTKKLREDSDPNVPIPHFFAMMLQGYVARSILGKSRHLGKLALGYKIFHLLAAPFILKYFCFVEPMLDVITFRYDSKLVVLTDGLQLLADRRNQAV